MSDAVVATLTAGEQAHLIEQRREVRDKFNEALFSLYIIKGLGQRSFYDPEQYLKNMKIEDATFNTDIPGELKRIETMLRQNKLEQQWKKEGRANNLESDEVDPEEAMSSWVHQQLEQGACSEVQLKLPYKKKGTGHDLVASMVAHQARNDQYEYLLQEREMAAPKAAGDKVEFEGRKAMVLKNVRGMCEVRWDKKAPDEDETAQIPCSDLLLISKAHPAMTITAETRAVTQTTPARWRHKSNTVSYLAPLFSDPEGPVPEFRSGAPESRKEKVERENQQRHVKMMTNRPQARSNSRAVAALASPRPSSRKLAGVQSKFRQRPPSGSVTRTVNKEPGVDVGLVFDPETLCVLDVYEASPAEAFGDLRGMRISHVSCREDHEGEFTTEESVNTREQLRRGLARAAESDVVSVKFEVWTQRRAVEKKKREFRERLIAHKDKKAAKMTHSY